MREDAEQFDKIERPPMSVDKALLDDDDRGVEVLFGNGAAKQLSRGEFNFDLIGLFLRVISLEPF
jgi:hypothetical protein